MRCWLPGWDIVTVLEHNAMELEKLEDGGHPYLFCEDYGYVARHEDGRRMFRRSLYGLKDALYGLKEDEE